MSQKVRHAFSIASNLIFRFHARLRYLHGEDKYAIGII